MWGGGVHLGRAKARGERTERGRVTELESEGYF